MDPAEEEKKAFLWLLDAKSGLPALFPFGKYKSIFANSAFLFLFFAIIFLETAGAAEAVSYNSRAGFLREGVWSILAFSSFFSLPLADCFIARRKRETEGRRAAISLFLAVISRNQMERGGGGNFFLRLLFPPPISREKEGGVRRGKTTNWLLLPMERFDNNSTRILLKIVYFGKKKFAKKFFEWNIFLHHRLDRLPPSVLANLSFFPSSQPYPVS